VNVRLFVEGGGNQRRTKTACRKAFHIFLEKLLGDRAKPRIVASGSRDEAYRDFSRALSDDDNTFPVLLVDSEESVPAGKTAIAHLRDRDRWANLPDDQVHLMVQCMETWFLADKAKLAKYYGDGFKESALPQNPTVEAISKKDVFEGLRRATTATTKGSYHKTLHGFDILERLDPENVRQQSPHAARLFTFLLARLV
jgi:Domain of unknown function (DUF4276)